MVNQNQLASAPSSAQDLIERELGVPVIWNEIGDGSVGTAAEELCKANPRRVAMIVFNLSANTIYIRPRRVASATAGISMAPGGFRSFWWKEDGPIPTESWTIVASAVSSAFYGLEALINGGPD